MHLIHLNACQAVRLSDRSATRKSKKVYCHVHCETESWLMNVTILVCGKDPVPYTGKFDIILLLCHMSVWHVRVWYVMGVKLSVSETSAKHWTCLFIPRIAQHVMMLTRLSMSTLWRTTVPLVPLLLRAKGVLQRYQARGASGGDEGAWHGAAKEPLQILAMGHGFLIIVDSYCYACCMRKKKNYFCWQAAAL